MNNVMGGSILLFLNQVRELVFPSVNISYATRLYPCGICGCKSAKSTSTRARALWKENTLLVKSVKIRKCPVSGSSTYVK